MTSDQDDLDVAVLLTSELVTNAILHTRTPVQVGVLIDDDKVLVCVADRLADSPPLVPRPPSGDRPGGRGLALVDRARRVVGHDDVPGRQDGVVRPPYAGRDGPPASGGLTTRPRTDTHNVTCAVVEV